MTQLNLSGKQSNNPKKNPITDPEGGSITRSNRWSAGSVGHVRGCDRGRQLFAKQQASGGAAANAPPEAPVVGCGRAALPRR